MTRYTVVWRESALNELLELWFGALSRDAVTSAAYSIDQILKSDAPTKGSGLSEGLRSLVTPPLSIIFTVRDDDRIVEVLRVRMA